jgi:hypothetical protein
MIIAQVAIHSKEECVTYSNFCIKSQVRDVIGHAEHRAM